MEDFSWLQDMITDDDLGLLNVKKKTSALTADEQLVSKFNEINYFVAQHGRVPAKDMKNISEFMLASRLEAIKTNPEQYMALADYDGATITSKKISFISFAIFSVISLLATTIPPNIDVLSASNAFFQAS